MSIIDCWKNGFSCPKKWDGLHDINKLVEHGLATEVTMSDIQRKVKRQFGDVGFKKVGKARVRLPSYALEQFIQRSQVDKNVYDTETGYICGDFSLGLYSEINLSPYWDAVVGIVITEGHAENIAWCSDWSDMFFIEPQNDKWIYPDRKVIEVIF